MRLMGIEGIAPKADTSRPAPENPSYRTCSQRQGLPRGSSLVHQCDEPPDGARIFVYLVAVMDWYSRRVLSWRVSNTMDAAFCIEALPEALSTFGRPEI